MELGGVARPMSGRGCDGGHRNLLPPSHEEVVQ